MTLRFLIDECLTPERAELATKVDLINQALEVFEEEDGSVEVAVYEIPDPV